MSQAVSETGETVELYPDSDNWPALQPFLVAHRYVVLPAGVWPIHQTLNIVRHGTVLLGRGVDATMLDLVAPFAGPVIGGGGQGTWAGGYPAADGVSIIGLTAKTSIDASAQCKCIYNAAGDDMLIENVRVRGSRYEGVVSASPNKRVTLRSVEAWDCGNGGDFYSLSTAGVNATSIDLLVEDFVCIRCGQGVETGNTRVVVRKGLVTDPGPGRPSIGVNVGSSGMGVYDTTVESVVVRGFEAAIGCGNGIGRLAKVVFRNNDVDGPIGFAGGTLNNNVPHADEGPSVYGSEIVENVIRLPSNVGAIGYNSGVVDNGGLFGREPLRVERNTIVVEDGVAGTNPLIFFAGKIAAECKVYDNVVYGLDGPPSRGDLASYTLLSNPTIAGMPNLHYGGNLAYGRDGRSRGFLVEIEGA